MSLCSASRFGSKGRPSDFKLSANPLALLFHLIVSCVCQRSVGVRYDKNEARLVQSKCLHAIRSTRQGDLLAVPHTGDHRWRAIPLAAPRRYGRRLCASTLFSWNMSRDSVAATSVLRGSPYHSALIPGTRRDRRLSFVSFALGRQGPMRRHLAAVGHVIELSPRHQDADLHQLLTARALRSVGPAAGISVCPVVSSCVVSLSSVAPKPGRS
jgi:hypothetical protein